MMKNRTPVWGSALLGLLTVLLTSLTTQAQPCPDPRRWADSLGAPIRQGHHIEWQRALGRRSTGEIVVTWSDTRTGDRDLYGQMINPDGSQRWVTTGIPLARYPQYRQEDCDVTPVTDGGWIMAWIEFREDSTGDIWAQKINDLGQPVWPANNFTGVRVDVFSTPVNELTVRIAPDLAGGAIIAWEDTRRGDPAEIYAQHVDANGNTWSQVLAVTDTLGEQIGITADSDGQGNMIVAWNDKRLASDQNIYAAKITPQRTLPWGSGVNGICVCCAPGSQDGVKICPDGNGGAYLVWRDQRGGAQRDLYAQRVNGSGTALWQADGVVVCDAIEDQNSPRISISMNGGAPDGAFIVWEDVRVNGYIEETYAQKLSPPNGASLWQANGLKICGNAESGGVGQTRQGGRQTTDLAGGAIIAWEDTRSDGNWLKCDLYAARVNATGNFVWGGDCGIPIAVAANQQVAPVLRVDEGNGVFIFWDDYRSGSQSIRYQNLDITNGQFTIPDHPDGLIVIYGLDGDANAPLSLPMTMGRVGVVWQDNRVVGGGTRLYYQIVDTTGHIEREMNGEPLVQDPGESPNQLGHQICPDGDAGFFVTFEDLRSGVKRIRQKRVGSDGVPRCSLEGNLVALAPGMNDQDHAYCASDGAGGSYVVWSGSDAAFLIDVYMMRMNDNCEPLWQAPVRLSTADADDIVEGVVTSSGGCCIVVWTSGGFGQLNVSAARVCQDGSVSWNREICSANGSQYEPTLFADEEGGAYFAWSDARTFDMGKDIYAQHVNAAGADSWTANGIVVATIVNDQKEPTIDIDSQRNLFVVWEDYRTGDVLNLDLYGQKITPAGQRLWPTDGKRIAVIRGDQTEAQLETEWNDGLYVFWTDYRGLYQDVYATHLDHDGNLTTDYWQADSGRVICDFYQGQLSPTTSDDGHGGILAFWQDLRASGKEPLINIWGQWVNDCTVGVTEVRGQPVPAVYTLEQNYPNPFNPTTSIRFSVPQTERVELTVFNLQGQQVSTLVDEVMTAGVYDVQFGSSRLASGIYFYRLHTPTFESVKKMTLLK
ncbi:T9SS type A sorting domain-containing protein [candidate division KSB1 bacterium]|nr:T9SS type A sorting domain-containing protein [candidate division KSB1 bacterium]